MRQDLGGLVLALCAFTALAPTCVLAETRALVVGASGYPALAEALRLTGPRNDTREFANTIVRLGVPAGNVTVLADGVRDLAPGIRTPGFGTKAAILSGLDELAAKSRKGDLAVFFFSGHGTQQPDLNGDEQGGADEIFLPYDVGKWGGSGIENGLLDDELHEKVKAILDTGADFFGVIDACNAATGFRAIAGDETKTREVAPELLGVPSFAPAATGRAFNGLSGTKPGRGRAAFFYAAQEFEEALEKVPPNGEEGESFGVFTYNLLKRMNETPNLTYRNLHQAVMSDIKRNTLMSTQTPEAEGDLLDEPVLQLSTAPERRQWQIYNGRMQGGQLDGVRTGSVMALYADAADPDDRAVAYGTVENAGATKSIVTWSPVSCTDQPANSTCGSQYGEEAFRKARFARIQTSGVDLSLSLSEPVRIDGSDGHDYAPTLAALRTAVASEPLKARVSFRRSGYDIAVGLVDGKLAFASSAGEIDAEGTGSSPRLTLPAEPVAAQAAIREAIARISRVTALQRLGAIGDGVTKVALETTLRVAKAKPSALKPDACSTAPEDYAPPVPAGDAPSFAECDIVSVEMANGGRKPLDVTALLVASDFSITPVWPLEGVSSRILQSESKTADMLQMERGAATAVDERLIFVAVPGVNRANVVFDSLEQQGLRAAPDDAPEIAAVRALLAEGVGDLSRAATTAPKIEEEMSVLIRPFHVGKGSVSN